MADKHALCKHKGSCLINALKGYLRGALIGLGIRTIIAIIFGLLKRTIFKNPMVLLKIFAKENMRLVYFLSGMIGVHRSVLCLMRRYTNNEKVSSFVAGFFGGLPLILEDADSRITYGLYILVRGLDALCKFLVSTGKVPKVPYLLEILYILSMTILVDSKAHNPECLNKGFSSMVNKMMKEPNDPVYVDFSGYHDKKLLKRNKQ